LMTAGAVTRLRAVQFRVVSTALYSDLFAAIPAERPLRHSRESGNPRFA
jgi:hypothetical protein